ncbi:MAG: hypothetical protein RR541_09665 [Carnobacterium sp.]
MECVSPFNEEGPMLMVVASSGSGHWTIRPKEGKNENKKEVHDNSADIRLLASFGSYIWSGK